MSALVRFLGEKYTIGQIVFFTLRVTASPSLRLLFAHSTWSFRQNGWGSRIVWDPLTIAEHDRVIHMLHSAYCSLQ
jgi:hypothetical protein